MAQGRAQSERSRKRERLTTLVLALFPLLVAVGFFAPGWVHILALAEPAEPGVRNVVVDRVGPWGHRPLMVPRDFSAGFIPELLDLDQLFLSSDFKVDPAGEQLARISAFERSYGDSIALDDVGQLALNIVFRDALMQRERQQLLAAADPFGTNLGLCGTLHASNCVRDDDLITGTIVTLPIPEPGSISLLALGLLGLAVAGQRRP